VFQTSLLTSQKKISRRKEWRLERPVFPTHRKKETHSRSSPDGPEGYPDNKRFEKDEIKENNSFVLKIEYTAKLDGAKKIPMEEEAGSTSVQQRPKKNQSQRFRSYPLKMVWKQWSPKFSRAPLATKKLPARSISKKLQHFKQKLLVLSFFKKLQLHQQKLLGLSLFKKLLVLQFIKKRPPNWQKLLVFSILKKLKPIRQKLLALSFSKKLKLTKKKLLVHSIV
jgi:hypothetical protein